MNKNLIRTCLYFMVLIHNFHVYNGNMQHSNINYKLLFM